MSTFEPAKNSGFVIKIIVVLRAVNNMNLTLHLLNWSISASLIGFDLLYVSWQLANKFKICSKVVRMAAASSFSVSSFAAVSVTAAVSCCILLVYK